MSEPIKQLKLALGAYATFSNPVVQEKATKLLNQVDLDIDGENYQPGEETDELTKQLVEAMNEADAGDDDEEEIED